MLKKILIPLTTLMFLFACQQGGADPGEIIEEQKNDPKATKLQCNEVMYFAGEYDELEWIEIELVQGEDIKDMAEKLMRLEKAVEFQFPAEPLKVNEKIVVTNDTNAFRARYPVADYPVRLFGPFEGRLDNAGELVDIKISGKGDASCQFSPEPPWPTLAAGYGHSLIYIDGDESRPESYGASVAQGGYPGLEKQVVESIGVLVNEIMPSGTATNPGWVEIYNPTKNSIDISGWELTESINVSGFNLPANTIVEAEGFLVIEEADWADNFYPPPNGGEVVLKQIVNGDWTGVTTGLSYPALAENQTAGVIELSDGNLSRSILKTATKGKANSEVFAGPIRISEFHYNPPEAYAEYMELVNASEEDVVLTNPWRIKGIAFTFDAADNYVVPPQGKLLMFRLDQAGSEENFRNMYNIPEDIICIPYEGRLSNRGELITLIMPITHAGGGIGLSWSDVVNYSDRGFWPGEADGYGKALKRVDLHASGEDSKNWVAADPAPAQK